MARKEKKVHGLVELVQADTKLDEEIKMEYLVLAQNFVEEFKDNLFKSSIELDDAFPFGLDTWQKFLNYAPIKRYLETFKNEIISQSATISMVSGNKTKDAIALRKELERDNSENTFENFVVFRLPLKDKEYEFTGDI